MYIVKKDNAVKYFKDGQFIEPQEMKSGGAIPMKLGKVKMPVKLNKWKKLAGSSLKFPMGGNMPDGEESFGEAFQKAASTKQPTFTWNGLTFDTETIGRGYQIPKVKSQMRGDSNNNQQSDSIYTSLGRTEPSNNNRGKAGGTPRIDVGEIKPLGMKVDTPEEGSWDAVLNINNRPQVANPYSDVNKAQKGLQGFFEKTLTAPLGLIPVGTIPRYGKIAYDLLTSDKPIDELFPSYNKGYDTKKAVEKGSKIKEQLIKEKQDKIEAQRVKDLLEKIQKTETRGSRRKESNPILENRERASNLRTNRPSINDRVENLSKKIEDAEPAIKDKLLIRQNRQRGENVVKRDYQINESNQQIERQNTLLDKTLELKDKAQKIEEKLREFQKQQEIIRQNRQRGENVESYQSKPNFLERPLTEKEKLQDIINNPSTPNWQRNQAWQDLMKLPKKAQGGYMNNLPKMPYGNSLPLSSNSQQVVNAGTHESGNDVPVMDENGQPIAEVENGEVIKDNKVFSERTGHAQIVSPIEKAKGILEAGLANISKDILGKGNFDRFAKAGIERKLLPLRQTISLLDKASENTFQQQEEAKVMNPNMVNPVNTGMYGKKLAMGGNPYPIDKKKSNWLDSYKTLTTPDFRLSVEDKNTNNLAPNKFDFTLPEFDIKLNADTLGSVGRGVATYGSDVLNMYLANRRPSISKPYLQSPAQLETTYNIQPELDEVTKGERNINRMIDTGTSDSNIALARKIAASTSGIGERNKLYGQKANIELGLRNQSAMNAQGITAQNISKLEGYKEARRNEDLSRQADISGIMGNVSNKFLLGEREKRQEAADVEKIVAEAISKSSDNGVIANFIMLPTYQKLLKENAYAREAVRDILKRNRPAMLSTFEKMFPET